MISANVPENEFIRLESLKRLNVLDSEPEPEFDALVKAASLVCNVPISLISLVDDKRQWFKANLGLHGVTETARDLAFCAHTILSDGLLEVNDTLQDARFSDNPLVLENPNIRFYAGATIKLSDGSNVGSLCVIDTKPKYLNDKEREILIQLAIAASKALERHRINKIQQSLNIELRLFIEQAPVAIAAFDSNMNYLVCSRRWIEDYNLQEQEIIGRNHYEIFPNIPERWKDVHQRCLEGEIRKSEEDSFVYNNNVIWNRWEIRPWFTTDQKVGGIVAYTENITERKLHEEELNKLNKKLWIQSNYDQLTQLANRNLMKEFLNEKIQETLDNHYEVALFLIDLDRFKEVNDVFGHHMGDELLSQVSKRLQQCVRETDMVARLGGDEFTICLLNMQEHNAIIEVMASKIVQVFSEPFLVLDKEVYLTCSLGIALAPKDAITTHDLLKMADQSMYSAKRQGGNRYVYFSSSMTTDAEERMVLSNDLRKAIKQNELMLYYQPIVSLSTGEIYKAEALLRWQHPTKGMISPKTFIQIAEENGLIIEIGNWVMLSAINFAEYLRKNYSPNFEISINKSPVQLANDGKLKKDISTTLIEDGLKAAGIVVEITEGMLLEDSIQINNKLDKLKNAGFKLSIDDFGTGYSSLSYLHKFNFDYLKIDISFIHKMETNPKIEALIEAIIVMSHKLGMKVIAEGIETENQKKILTQAGCDFGQGYLWSKPLPMDEFESILKVYSLSNSAEPVSI